MPAYERRSGGTSAEPRGAQPGARAMATSSTRRGGATTTTGVERIAQRARSQPEAGCTALLPHFTVDNLRACFLALDGTKAPGVAGSPKAMEGQPLEEHLHARHPKLHHMSYRPHPVRRVEIPQADGTTRPLGGRCTADQIVQARARRLLEAIHEPVGLETSYGFRPGRSGHDARRRLHAEVLRPPITWIVDLALAQFFDTRPQQEILAVLAQRSTDVKFLRLIARRRKAGVPTPGGVGQDALGSPQGSLVSPGIAKVVLDTVLDQGLAPVVTRHSRGYGAILRYAAETMTLFAREDDAHRLRRVLPLRLGQCGLRLHTHKTHLRAFGKQGAWQALQTGHRPATVASRGFTHDWGRSRKGRVRGKRKTAKKRLRRALRDLTQWLRQERPARKLPDRWQAIARTMRGHFNYCGVTDHSRARYRFERAVYTLLCTWLNHRSPRRSFTWERFRRYAARHPLPRPGPLLSMDPVGGRAGGRGLCGKTAGRLRCGGGAQRCRVAYWDTLETERRAQPGTQSSPTHWRRPRYSTKTYPTFDVLGTQLEMARSKANDNLHKLSPMLYDPLVCLELMPYRALATPEDWKAALHGMAHLLIDATARADHRATDDAKQRAHYRGKKTAYAEAYGHVPA
jgi:RNA-directed DNA polymerase